MAISLAELGDSLAAPSLFRPRLASTSILARASWLGKLTEARLLGPDQIVLDTSHDAFLEINDRRACLLYSAQDPSLLAF
eukprot:CAMPEP_0197582752 /NCGR_PEP_ID=MMETSP1326-20131121/5880_1 /TAXON_ID=1155430 /ORGANISM="Genus nov. species nov., Strain RCC2288" /LENGTH=79 /DNA_ID=CAMNT_0043146881 /DNA_START=666 /DNA_END=905 /DNA_ORIENTATION=-